MYDFFHGIVRHIDVDGRLSFDVGGVGYLLRISEQTRQALPLDGSDTTIYARLVVREDDMQLFGFAERGERAAFDLLTSVQGVGPVVALAVLSAFSVIDLVQVLAAGDDKALRKVKGVGAKSASRLTLELQDKVERIPVPRAAMPEATSLPEDESIDEARQALIALGFSNRDALAALDKVAKTGAPAEELLRLALGVLR